MSKHAASLTFFLAALVFPSVAFGQAAPPAEQGLEAKLRQVIASNVEALRSENKKASLATFHSASPNRQKSAAMMDAYFSQYDFAYEVEAFHLIGADDEYAVARYEQNTRKLGGAATPHSASTMDMMTVFRQEDGQWKIWTSVQLSAQVQ